MLIERGGMFRILEHPNNQFSQKKTNFTHHGHVFGRPVFATHFFLNFVERTPAIGFVVPEHGHLRVKGFLSPRVLVHARGVVQDAHVDFRAPHLSASTIGVLFDYRSLDTGVTLVRLLNPAVVRVALRKVDQHPDGTKEKQSTYQRREYHYMP